MTQSSQDFYDQFFDDYHLIFEDWEGVVKNQGRALKTFIQKYISSSQNLSVLDCSCGIGAQAIGLALEGYQVTGTDLSSKEIERAGQDAKRFGASLTFQEADFRCLEKSISEKFDVVLSYDNAIGHLKNLDELNLAFASMRGRLKDHGTLLVSVRDYDFLRAQKPCGTLPRSVKDSHGERIIVQTWEWNQEGDGYDLTLFVLKKENDGWSTQAHGPVAMHGFNKVEIEEALQKNGASEVRWFSPQESRYYQPVILTRFGELNRLR